MIQWIHKRNHWNQWIPNSRIRVLLLIIGLCLALIIPYIKYYFKYWYFASKYYGISDLTTGQTSDCNTSFCGLLSCKIPFKHIHKQKPITVKTETTTHTSKYSPPSDPRKPKPTVICDIPYCGRLFRSNLALNEHKYFFHKIPYSTHTFSTSNT